MSSDEHSSGSSAGMPAGHDPSASESMAGASQSIPDPMIGQNIGRYQIFAKLGEGGMGEVYAAEHVSIHKRVAIKLLRPEITSNEEAVARFEQEAKSSSKIGHKNIIGIDDFGTMPDGRIFLFMELLDGQPLNDMLEQPMESSRLLNILIQTCHGLAAAHDAGVVHRDMKPENIFVTTGDVPKLLDFGIAKVAQGEGENHLTRTGTIFGTPFYMAPEQALGQGVDHRADIYAMGVIMYECFCGSVPFQGESFMGILTQHITAEPKPPLQMAHEIGGQQRLAMIPAGIPEIIAKCMAKDPNQRYQRMKELIEDLVDVHRGVAGPGMSGYLEAQPLYAPPSGLHQSMPTPMPTPAIPPSQATMAAPSGGYATPASGGYATDASGRYHADASQSFAAPQPKKGKGGIIIVLLALLLVGGGVGGFLWWQSQQGDTTAKAGGGDDKGDKDNPLAGGGEDASAGNDEPVEFDAAVVAAGTPDAGTGEASSPDAAAAKVETIIVVINSKPQGAAVYRDGEKLDELTPTNISVNKGEQVELVLKRRGRKDETIVVDGSKTKVTARLKRERRAGGQNGKNGKDGKDGKDGKVPVKPKRCSVNWCKIPANKSEMCCELE
ncbi:MAG: protein kinase [Deltaproteobacteria bacterium]|nr:protein kinase [Deltaproteobacteria bacterium]